MPNSNDPKKPGTGSTRPGTGTKPGTGTGKGIGPGSGGGAIPNNNNKPPQRQAPAGA